METGSAVPSVASPSAAFAPQTQIETLEFRGSGGEYFGIWIVNLVLTILTLGIYSAWAKVRRLRYFYQHTELAGAHFDYHGDPIAILKGRLVALGLLLAYNLSIEVSTELFVLTLLLVIVVMPWLLRQSFRFRMHYSSYRGLRFAFKGTTKDSYITFLFYGFFTIITLYLAAPLMHQRLKQYQHGHAQFGQTRFAFGASVAQFYKAWGVVMALGLVLAVAAIGIPATLAAAFKSEAGARPDAGAVLMITGAVFLIFIVGGLLLAPLWEARTQNLIWNHTSLGPHRFESTLSAWRLMGIQVSNFILILFTLGLFLPWAQVRLARYRASTLTMITAGPLDDFLAAQEAGESATGEETAEFFDIDIGL